MINSINGGEEGFIVQGIGRFRQFGNGCQGNGGRQRISCRLPVKTLYNISEGILINLIN